jgi:hypothetical protein
VISHKEVLNTCKFQIQEPGRSKTVDNKIYAAWNVRGVTDKAVELNEVLQRRDINIAVINETKKKITRN